MNSAIDIEFQSIQSNKSYTLKVFPKGKIVISGLNRPFEQSEVSGYVYSLIASICSSLKIATAIPSTIKTTLSNFITSVRISSS
jgi:hypothetical protein